jgi:hypothetical protein
MYFMRIFIRVNANSVDPAQVGISGTFQSNSTSPLLLQRKFAIEYVAFLKRPADVFCGLFCGAR